jgi:predicted MFS family arabinose efflux permease
MTTKNLTRTGRLRSPASEAVPARPRLLTRQFLLLGAAELAYFTADGVAVYTLPVFATGPVGAGEAGAGLAFGAFALSALLLRPLAGRLADTRGRRPLLVGGALLCALGMALTVPVAHLTTLVAARLLLGVAEAAFFVAAFAALADIAPPSRLGEALSYNSLGLYLGLAVGPPLGEVVVERSGFAAAWATAALLALASAATALLLGETARPTGDEPPSASLVHWASVPVALGFLASIVAMGGYLAFAALRAEDVGMANPSLPLFLYGSTVVVCRVVFARVPDRVPPLPLGAAALATITGGLVVMAGTGSPAGLLVGTVLLATGVAFSTPAFFAAVFACARASERGAAAGTASMAIDLGLGVGPIALGLVAGATGLGWAFATAAAVALAGSGWTLALHRTSRWADGHRAAITAP